MTLTQLLNYYYVGSEYEIELAKLQGALSGGYMGCGITPKIKPKLDDGGKPDIAGIKSMLGG
jgi:hypothetical protein